MFGTFGSSGSDTAYSQFHEKDVHDFDVALAVACAAYREQGYVKMSDEGTPNRFLVHATLVQMNPTLSTLLMQMSEYLRPSRIDRVRTVTVRDVDYESAKVIKSHFDQKTILEKLGDSLDKFGDGTMRMIKEGKVHNTDLGILASMPYSYFIDSRRKSNKEFWAKHQQDPKGYIGEPRTKVVLKAMVQDVMFFKKTGNFMIVLENHDGKLAKIFNDNEKTVAPFKNWIGKNIVISAYVKRHCTHQKFQCQETILHKVQSVQYVDD